MRLPGLALLALALGGCSSGALFERAEPRPFAIEAALDTYQRGCHAVLAALDQAAPVEAIVREATALLDLSRSLAGEIAVAYPPCGPYLGKTLSMLRRLAEISPKVLERDYHADGALPEAPGWCYPAKDLVVHPAMVLVLAREGGAGVASATRAQMRAEIVEVLSHLGSVRQLIELSRQ